MNKTRIIPSQLFNTGVKFIVAENSTDGTFGPGTTGFISYVKGRDRDYPNVVFLRVVITRRGKTGKTRFDASEISTPIFDFENKILEKLLPNEKRRYYVHIKPVNDISNNVLEMSNKDYFGWASSYAKYIHKLNSRARHVSIWPRERKNILNRILHVHDFYLEDPDYTEDKYANKNSRLLFIDRIRIMEVTLVRCCLSYMSKVAKIEASAITDIFKRNSKENVIGPKSVLKATQTLFSEKSSSLSILAAYHGKHKSLVDGLSKVVSW